jgi:hypothetical protein
MQTNSDVVPSGPKTRRRSADRLRTRCQASTAEERVTGDTLQANGSRITEVYFPNGGVFSVTNQMRMARSSKWRLSAARASPRANATRSFGHISHDSEYDPPGADDRKSAHLRTRVWLRVAWTRTRRQS